MRIGTAIGAGESVLTMTAAWDGGLLVPNDPLSPDQSKGEPGTYAHDRVAQVWVRATGGVGYLALSPLEARVGWCGREAG